jgi:type VI secretion system protein ImpE
MLAEDLLKQARLTEALAALQDAVRKDASNPKLRVFLFQLLSVLGDWKRAVDQLAVSSQLDAKNLLMAQMYKPAIMCELLRADVFAGKRSPMILGEPEAWIGGMIQALSLDSQGHHAAASAARAKALEEAPAISGSIDGTPFEWIMDADSRLGPMLELITDGKYYWVPWSRIREINIEAPADLRDTVWLPAIVTLATGATQPAIIPTRYPGSEASKDDAVRLSRKTDFTEPHEGTTFALGQRVFATDADDYSLLSIRKITLNVPEVVPVPGAAAGGATGG